MNPLDPILGLPIYFDGLDLLKFSNIHRDLRQDAPYKILIKEHLEIYGKN